MAGYPAAASPDLLLVDEEFDEFSAPLATFLGETGHDYTLNLSEGASYE